jgi:hypothetical protein
MTKRNIDTGADGDTLEAFGCLLRATGNVFASIAGFLEALGNFVIALKGLTPICVGITALVMLLLGVT